MDVLDLVETQSIRKQVDIREGTLSPVIIYL